jgi:hypothetical protein
METKFICDLMLPYFTGCDECRPALQKVHKSKNGFVYATDGRIAIRVPQEKVHKGYSEVPGFPNVELVIQSAVERQGNKSAVVETAKLIRLLAGVSWRRNEHGDDCEECDGAGVVECEACGSENDCKKCDGKGVVNMRVEEYSLLKCKDAYYIKIGAPTYNAEYLHIVALMAQMLQVDEITYLYKEEGAPAIFSFDGVDILLSSRMDDYADAELNLN